MQGSRRQTHSPAMTRIKLRLGLQMYTTARVGALTSFCRPFILSSSDCPVVFAGSSSQNIRSTPCARKEPTSQTRPRGPARCASSSSVFGSAIWSSSERSERWASVRIGERSSEGGTGSRMGIVGDAGVEAGARTGEPTIAEAVGRECRGVLGSLARARLRALTSMRESWCTALTAQPFTPPLPLDLLRIGHVGAKCKPRPDGTV